MNTTSCSASGSGSWSGTKATSGSASTGAITATTVYTLDCSGPGGTASQSVSVTVDNATGVTVTPRNVALTLGQTQQFSAAAPGGGAVTWKVDGADGGSNTVGTISVAGLYTPPGTAGAHSITATSVADTSKSGTAALAVTDLAGVYTYHSDAARTGQNLKEYALTPASVSGGNFGRRWSCAVDGEIHAQPLYVARNSLAGGQRNLVIVATQHDSVYAFDADSPNCALQWQVSFLSSGVTTIPVSDTPGCNDIHTEFGITGTPVIDPATETLYVVAATKESGAYVQRLHALNLTDGSERSGSPTAISATINGTGGATINFDPLMHLQRAGLALSGGGVFVAFASHCDHTPYWGWLMRYSTNSLAQTAALNVAPNGNAGGIWMSGGAPAFDASGAMFLNTGNGGFNLFTSGPPPVFPYNDYSMSFLNINPATLVIQDFYAPSQEAVWSNADLDISSAGVTVLPNGAGPSTNPNLLVGADKGAHLWLLDRGNLGNYSSSADNVVQYLSLPGSSGFRGVFSTPSYYNGTVYLGGVNNPLMAFPLSNGLFNANAQIAVPGSSSSETYTFPGTVPAVSASPAGGAIVWALDNSGYNGSPGPRPAILRAYSAANLATTLYSSATVAGDAAGYAIKFTTPVIANGHVYVGGGDQLTVYGLAP